MLLIMLLVGISVVVGFGLVGNVAINIIDISAEEAMELSRLELARRLKDAVLSFQIILLVGIALVYVAVGFALKLLAPYEKSTLLWATIGVIVPLCFIPMLSGRPVSLLTTLLFIGAGVGIIYGIGQFWVEGDGKMHPRYLGVIRGEDGSMSQVKWLPMTGKITLHSPKTRYVEELGVATNHQEALAFFNHLRTKRPAEAQPSGGTQE